MLRVCAISLKAVVYLDGVKMKIIVVRDQKLAMVEIRQVAPSVVHDVLQEVITGQIQQPNHVIMHQEG